jgi:hypothetical protein
MDAAVHDQAIQRNEMKPIVSSSGKSRARRPSGALRTARFLLRKVATAGIAVTILGLLMLLF